MGRPYGLLELLFQLIADIETETWTAFCSHGGAHATPSRPWTDWNAEILAPLINDMEESEATFRAAFEQTMQRFHDTTDAELTALSTSIAGKLKASSCCIIDIIINMNIERIQIESFGQTLPRRRRALEYEIEDLKAEFISNLEQVS